MNKKFIILFFLINYVTSYAQTEKIFNGIRFNDSISTVIHYLKPITKSLKLMEVSPPSFPLAKYSEKHLIANKVVINNKTIDRIVFTFSDKKLSLVSAQGNIKALQINKKEKPMKYIHFLVYLKDLLFLNLKEDKAWILTKKATHPNLFAWNNPYLNNVSKTMVYNSSAKLPSFLSMGESYKKSLKALKKNSLFSKIDTLDGSDPNAQIQINSFAIEYAGFPRKFEARFGDNKLNVIWILTAKEEESRIRKQLIKAYGNPIFKNNNWEFFNNWTIGLRKDKPEVLFLTQELGLSYKKRFLNKKIKSE